MNLKIKHTPICCVSDVYIHAFCCFGDFICPNQITLSLVFTGIKSEENIFKVTYANVFTYNISMYFSSVSFRD